MNLPDEFVLPDYNGRSVANIPATIANLLDADFHGLPPLYHDLWQPVAGDVKRVVVILLDAMGWNLYEQERPFFHQTLGEPTVASKLTSIFPSTTVAALSSFWTGYAPAQHSFLGFRLFLPDLATVGQLINFTPAYGKYNDTLVESGLDPKLFLQVPGFAQVLSQSNIPTYSLKERFLADTALSQMHGRGIAGELGAVSFAHMMVDLRQLLEKKVGEKLYAFAYWSTIDSLSHHYNWQDCSVTAELHTLLDTVRRELFEQLSEAAREGTAVFIAADHGQVVCPVEEQIHLDEHPELARMLLMQPTGDTRAIYLYAKNGCQADIIHYVRENLAHAFVPIPSLEALSAGLFGPQPYAVAALERVGDVVLLARGGTALFNKLDGKRSSTYVGWHGSLEADEMYVPLLGYRLDR